MVNHQISLKLLLNIQPTWAAFDFDELFKTRLSGIKMNFYILNISFNSTEKRPLNFDNKLRIPSYLISSSLSSIDSHDDLSSLFSNRSTHEKKNSKKKKIKIFRIQPIHGNARRHDDSNFNEQMF